MRLRLSGSFYLTGIVLTAGEEGVWGGWGTGKIEKSIGFNLVHLYCMSVRWRGMGAARFPADGCVKK